jgi:hypothetical protein
MLKVVATNAVTGRKTLYLGLSFGNLKRFRQEPEDTYININGEELGLPCNVVLFSGRTEEEMAKLFPGITQH